MHKPVGRSKAPERPKPINWRPQTVAQVEKWKEIGGAKWLRRTLEGMMK